MEYRVVTVHTRVSSCLVHRLADIHDEIQAECNRQSREGFVLVSAFDTRSPMCICCNSYFCEKKAACLVFARP